uniref:Uncharacterized protein n=1 Tax=virus sp. ctE0n6 TaxID=2827985 RepID=A0A8S5RFW4_9VIRU|nr:MAG TPA: hypothetical protein [virus sp. ctE0n6]
MSRVLINILYIVFIISNCTIYSILILIKLRF